MAPAWPEDLPVVAWAVSTYQVSVRDPKPVKGTNPGLRIADQQVLPVWGPTFLARYCPPPPLIPKLLRWHNGFVEFWWECWSRYLYLFSTSEIVEAQFLVPVPETDEGDGQARAVQLGGLRDWLIIEGCVARVPARSTCTEWRNGELFEQTKSFMVEKNMRIKQKTAI